MYSRLDTKTIQDTTVQFYSRFCGVNLEELQPGTHFICSAERDKVLKGFGCKYTLFIFLKDGLSVVSYAPKYQNLIESLKKLSIDEIICAVEQKHKLKHMKLLIFHKEKVTRYKKAKILSLSDYPLYEKFFRTVNPSANPDGWLYGYFSEKASKGYFTGYIKDGRLVSVCDAPDMPYMQDKIQHTGVETLKEERRRGYARCVTALSVHNLIENGICPQWECEAENIPSFELARSIGYEQFGQAYILEE